MALPAIKYHSTESQLRIIHNGNQEKIKKPLFSKKPQLRVVEKSEKRILDYFAFGFENSDRSMSSDVDNTFGFNGKLRDNKFGTITNYDYGFRIYNPGIARFLSVDPLKGSYPYYTPYQFAGNKPIWAIDLDGAEEAYVTSYNVILDDKGNFTTKMLGRPVLENKDGDWTGVKNRSQFFFQNKIFSSQSEIPGWQNWREAQQAEVTRNTANGLLVAGGIAVTCLTAGTGTAAYISFSGLAVSASLEIGVSLATGSSVDYYDAVAGAGGPLFYALTTPLYDLDSKDGFRTVFDKGLGQSFFEFGANTVGFGLGKAAQKLATKGASLTSKGHNLKSLTESLNYYSQQSAQTLTKKGTELITKGSMYNRASKAATVGGNVEDVITKSKLKNSDEN